MEQTPSWKIILAFFLDFIGSFIVFSITASLITGGFYRTEINRVYEYGFHLSWLAVLIVVVCIVGYFKLMRKYYGGTLGKKLLKIADAKK